MHFHLDSFHCKYVIILYLVGFFDSDFMLYSSICQTEFVIKFYLRILFVSFFIMYSISFYLAYFTLFNRNRFVYIILSTCAAMRWRRQLQALKVERGNILCRMMFRFVVSPQRTIPIYAIHMNICIFWHFKSDQLVRASQLTFESCKNE